VNVNLPLDIPIASSQNDAGIVTNRYIGPNQPAEHAEHIETAEIDTTASLPYSAQSYHALHSLTNFPKLTDRGLEKC
jgi:hypothetical protein